MQVNFVYRSIVKFHITAIGTDIGVLVAFMMGYGYDIDINIRGN